jgi:glucose-6-phosphate isomerase
MDHLTLHLDGAMAEAIGAEHGVTSEEWEGIQAQVATAHAALLERRSRQVLGFADLPFHEEQVSTLLTAAQHVKFRFDHLVVLGIGGSSLGLRAIENALLNPAFTAAHALDRRSVPDLHIFDNVDPDAFLPILDQLDWSKTCVNVISKSGKTAETGAQFLIVQELLQKKLGAQKWRDHVIVTTDPATGPLRAAAICEGLKSFSIPSNVGGRFSCLSPVGLFPAACAGIDIAELLRGARTMAQTCLAADEAWNLGAQLAALHFLLDTRHQKSMTVWMPYVQSLRQFTDWCVQLWAESLGKEGKGMTPIPAIGVTDQHSQLQLFAEGPNNKLITMITAKAFVRDTMIPKTDDPAFAFLGGHSLVDLLNTEAAATRQSLREQQRPVAHLEIAQLTPATLGALLFACEWATAMAGELYGINAFDQPGVERGKVVMREMLAQ